MKIVECDLHARQQTVAAWRLLPGYPDYVDGRGGPFGGEIILRSFELVGESLDSPQWQQEAASRNINTVVVSVDRELGEGLSGLDMFLRQRGMALRSFDQAEKASPFGNGAPELGASFHAQIEEGQRREGQDLK